MKRRLKMAKALTWGWKRFLFSTLAKQVVFLGKEEIVSFRYSGKAGGYRKMDGGRSTTKSAYFPKNSVVAVGRELYFEINHTFPITTSRDLANAVALEAPALTPQAYCRYTFFPHKEGTQSRVNFWFFQPELKDWIDRLKPMILLPESALVGLSETGNASAISYGKRRGHFLLCFRKQRGDLLSRLVPEDRGEREALLEFKRLVGFEAGDVESTFLGASTELSDSGAEVQDYYSTLTEKLQTFPFTSWPRFFCRERFRSARISRPYLYFLAALLLVFFMLPPVFSYWHTASINSELVAKEKQIVKKVGLYLTMKEEVEKKTDLLKKLQRPINELVPRTILLSEMGRFIKPPEDTLKSFRLIGDNLEIRGGTQSSSDLMGRLGKSRFFIDVRLSSPVIKDRKSGKERFVIEITVKNPEADPEGATKPKGT